MGEWRDLSDDEVDARLEHALPVGTHSDYRRQLVGNRDNQSTAAVIDSILGDDR